MAVEHLIELQPTATPERWGLAGVLINEKFDSRTDTLLHALQACPHFSDVAPTVLSQLAEIVVIHRYRKNQVLFIEGDTNRALYFVLSGLVKVYQLTKDGRERIDSFVGQGEFVGTASFGDGASYPVSAEVFEDGDIAMFRWDEFHLIARDNPDVLFALVALMAKQLRQAQADIHALSLHSAAARLAGKLLDLADDFGKVYSQGIGIQLQLNREQLGALVGTSRETTTRVLRQFEEERIIKLDGPCVTILKPFILQSLSEG